MVQGDILCGYQVRGAEDTVLNPGSKNQARSWDNVDMVVIRNEDDGFAAHESPYVPVVSEDFERTTRSRQVKATYSRQRLLDAIVHESDLSNFNEVGSDGDRATIMRALHSFDSEFDDFSASRVSSMTDVLSTQTPQVSVRALVAAARILADALEKADASHEQNT